MKKIHLISKTHLDLGFTDYAKNVIDSYRKTFIPSACTLGDKLNKERNTFVWTTGSYLIRDSLAHASIKHKKLLDDTIKAGDIAWHGLPFTTHTELATSELFSYALGFSKELDKKYKRRTISAKMTDVPGHTKAMLPLLAQAGIRFLHIGVNNASSVPDVPSEFVWRMGDAEIVVVYEGAYGGIYRNKYIDDILCFLHSNDNCGPSSEKEVIDFYAKLQEQYPDYEIVPSSLDAYGRAMWEVRDKLPVVTSEIGDTWIHGVGSDPYKVGAYRELAAALDGWLAQGLLDRKSKEYEAFCENLLLITEHTWGMDVKRYLADYDNYLKPDFERARAEDKVKFRLKNIFKSFSQKYFDYKERRRGEYSRGSYSAMEASWEEQREYIHRAIAALPIALQKDAKKRLEKLVPKGEFNKKGYEKGALQTKYQIGEFEIAFSSSGIDRLSHNGKVIVEGKEGFIRYASYSSADYLEYKNTYARDYENCKVWIGPDFHKPGLKYADGKYPSGDFYYQIEQIYVNKKDNSIIATFAIEKALSEACGAPRHCEAKFTVKDGAFKTELIWWGKDASRLPEAIFVNFGIKVDKDSLSYIKMGKSINPYDIAPYGNRNLSAIEKAEFACEGKPYTLTGIHSPLAAIGKGKVLRVDNKYGDIEQGVSFNLLNNLWGTNFPLWYDQNAYFEFILSAKESKRE